MWIAIIKPQYSELKPEEVKRRAKILAGQLRALSSKENKKYIFGLEYHKRGDEIFIYLIANNENALNLLINAFQFTYPDAMIEFMGQGHLEIDESLEHVYSLKLKDWRKPIPFVYDTTFGRPDFGRALTDLMGALPSDIVVQILFKPAGTWERSVEGYYLNILRRKRGIILSNPNREDYIYRDLAEAVMKKAGEGGFEVTIRIAASQEDDAKSIVNFFAGVRWEWGGLVKVKSSFDKLVKRSLTETTRLSAGELANFIVLPYGVSPFIRSSFIPPVKPPIAVIKKFFGPSEIPGESSPIIYVNGLEVHLKVKDLLRHMLITGTSGAGKTTYMSWLITSMLEHVGGVFIILSPKKGEARNILGYIKTVMGEEWTKKHVIVIDFKHSFLKYNLFRVPPEFFIDEAERDRVMSNALAELKNFFFESRGQKMEETAPNVAILLQAASRYLFTSKIDLSNPDRDQITILDLLKVLSQFKEGEVPLDADPLVKTMMRDISGKIPTSTIMAMYNRLFKFLLETPLRAMTAYRGPDVLDIPEMLKRSKPMVLLLDLGEFTEIEMKRNLMIAMILIVTKAIIMRPEPNPPVWLFVDEFREVADIGMFKWILAEARSLGMGLFLGLQFPEQITKHSLFLEVIGNTNTMVFFKTKMKPNIDSLRMSDRDYNEIVPRIPLYHALFLLGTGEEVITPFIVKTPPPPDFYEISEKEYEEFVKECAKIWHLEKPRLPDLVEEIESQSVDEVILEIMRDGKKRSIEQIHEILKKRGIAVSEMELVDTLERMGDLIERIEKGKKILYKIKKVEAPSAGPTLKGGGEKHRVLAQKVHRYFMEDGYRVTYPKQIANERQPDLIAKRGEEELAIEIEATLKHPKQVVKNFRKNKKLGYRVVFVVPDNLEAKLRNIMRAAGVSDDEYDVLTESML